MADQDLLEITNAAELVRVLNANPGATSAFWKGLVVNLLDRAHHQNAAMAKLLDLTRRLVVAAEGSLERSVAIAPTLNEPVISPTDLATLLGVSTSTVDRMVKDGRLPPPAKLSERKVCWTLAQVFAARNAGLYRDKPSPP